MHSRQHPPVGESNNALLMIRESYFLKEKTHKNEKMSPVWDWDTNNKLCECLYLCEVTVVVVGGGCCLCVCVQAGRCALCGAAGSPECSQPTVWRLCGSAGVYERAPAAAGRPPPTTCCSSERLQTHRVTRCQIGVVWLGESAKGVTWHNIWFCLCVCVSPFLLQTCCMAHAAHSWTPGVWKHSSRGKKGLNDLEEKSLTVWKYRLFIQHQITHYKAQYTNV